MLSLFVAIVLAQAEEIKREIDCNPRLTIPKPVHQPINISKNPNEEEKPEKPEKR